MDLVTESQVGEWVSVNGYPTFKLFVNGNELEYDGDREPESILTFINSASSSKLTLVDSLSTLTAPFVALHGVSEDSELHLLPLKFT